VQLAADISPPPITISSTSLGFNPAADVSVNGKISIFLEAEGGFDPGLTFPMFSGTILVSWPSKTGPQSANATIVGLTLTGFVG
jgi:NhaP-type Na+/H+ or K+/H+ antiporter